MTTLALSLPGAPNKTLLLCIFARINLALFLLPLLSVVFMYVCLFSGRNLFLSMSTGNSIGCISELNPNPVFLLFFSQNHHFPVPNTSPWNYMGSPLNRKESKKRSTTSLPSLWCNKIRLQTEETAFLEKILMLQKNSVLSDSFAKNCNMIKIGRRRRENIYTYHRVYRTGNIGNKRELEL